ncbi:hypothetical protein [Paraburkholderia terrae]|uniref:hypothetical protein n=1 Tax=Paraburkholderia terrae TaxID=311230 RepID=UPI0020BF1764|nr:hypothetical protein [Paraburkholderia terrae]
MQIPITVTAETRAQFEALADERQEPFGEVRALAALRRELDGNRGPSGRVGYRIATGYLVGIR